MMTPAEFLSKLESYGPLTDEEARKISQEAKVHLIKVDFGRHGPRGCPDPHCYVRGASCGRIEAIFDDAYPNFR